VADRLKVLIVDDSAVIRRIIGEAVSSDPDLELVGTAANGRIALERIGQLAVDLVTLDVEMPDMDGLATLREIRKIQPLLPVVMFSSLTERGARTTIEALTAGASDYVCKPRIAGGGPEAALKQVKQELLPRLRVLGARARARRSSSPTMILSPLPSSAPAPPPPVAAAPRAREARAEILVIGVSTGGPGALGDLLPRIPATFPLPILITQHMPPLFTKLLAERLSENCRLRVEEARQGRALEPGLVLIAPGDFHMVVRKQTGPGVVGLNQGPQENGCRPAVDPMFRSAADLYGPGVLGFILTGMGNDGLRGATSIKEKGGRVWVQDEASSVVWSMPGAVYRAGLADRVANLKDLADALDRLIKGEALMGTTPASRHRSA
jgi:two-component system chemotaxis response regulator CheB